MFKKDIYQYYVQTQSLTQETTVHVLYRDNSVNDVWGSRLSTVAMKRKYAGFKNQFLKITASGTMTGLQAIKYTLHS
jgi:hypothetical protein